MNVEYKIQSFPETQFMLKHDVLSWITVINALVINRSAKHDNLTD